VQRPNVIPGVPFYLPAPGGPCGRVINAAAFTIPVSGQGNLGRHALRGCDAVQFDTTLRRRFHLTERLALQERADLFHIFNLPNFGSPINFISSPQFGQPAQMLASSLGSGGQSGGLIPLYRIGGPRSIQLAFSKPSWLCRVLKTCIVTGKHVGVPGPPNLFSSRKLHGINEPSPRMPGLSPRDRNGALHRA
jgi:hypothetical protein